MTPSPLSEAAERRFDLNMVFSFDKSVPFDAKEGMG